MRWFWAVTVVTAGVFGAMLAMASQPAWAQEVTAECHKFTIDVKVSGFPANAALTEEYQAGGEWLPFLAAGTHTTDADGNVEYSLPRQLSTAAAVCGLPGNDADQLPLRITRGGTSVTVTPSEERSWWEHLLNLLAEAPPGENIVPEKDCVREAYAQAPLGSAETTAEIAGLYDVVPPGGVNAIDDFPVTVATSVDLTEAGAPRPDPLPIECNQFASFLIVGGVVEVEVNASDPPVSARGDNSKSLARLYGAVAGGIAGVLIALAGGGWFVRRRFVR